MRIIPVIDLREGFAHHARGGNRSHYRRLVSGLLRPSEQDPVAPTAQVVAQAFRDALGVSEIYVADLDAIDHGRIDLATYENFRQEGFRVWLDLGIDSLDKARQSWRCAYRLILGLESLPGPEFVERIAKEFDPGSLALSLDLRAGKPILAKDSTWASTDPAEIVEIARDAGLRHIILLDLARVGSGQGTGTDTLLSALARRFPDMEWIVGGGFASLDQIGQAADRGASAALVGSALHDGRIGRAEIEHLLQASPKPFDTADLGE